MPTKLLILGGTSEANALAARLAGDPRFTLTLSLAGRTENPRLPPAPTRIGGFGGAAGLADYLRAETVDVLLDATHPFAEQISANARAAAELANVSLIVLGRAPWQPVAGDRWTIAGDLAAAAGALPAEARRVFLTVGRQSLAPFAAHPQHHYVIRVIDPPEIPAAMRHVAILTGRGPFQIEDETALLRDQRIDWLVTKNSGGKASSAKLAAARALGVPVILVAQPPARADAHSLERVLELLVRHHDGLAKRSV